eukprot:m.186251 g.186251  ORF g.186251 m.186251 type:complete len:534 (-) comp14752_c0_seq3:110-1711(-)
MRDFWFCQDLLIADRRNLNVSCSLFVSRNTLAQFKQFISLGERPLMKFFFVWHCSRSLVHCKQTFKYRCLCKLDALKAALDSEKQKVTQLSTVVKTLQEERDGLRKEIQQHNQAHEQRQRELDGTLQHMKSQYQSEFNHLNELLHKAWEDLEQCNSTLGALSKEAPGAVFRDGIDQQEQEQEDTKLGSRQMESVKPQFAHLVQQLDGAEIGHAHESRPIKEQDEQEKEEDVDERLQLTGGDDREVRKDLNKSTAINKPCRCNCTLLQTKLGTAIGNWEDAEHDRITLQHKLDEALVLGRELLDSLNKTEHKLRAAEKLQRERKQEHASEQSHPSAVERDQSLLQAVEDLIAKPQDGTAKNDGGGVQKTDKSAKAGDKTNTGREPKALQQSDTHADSQEGKSPSNDVPQQALADAKRVDMNSNGEQKKQLDMQGSPLQNTQQGAQQRVPEGAVGGLLQGGGTQGAAVEDQHVDEAQAFVEHKAVEVDSHMVVDGKESVAGVAQGGQKEEDTVFVGIKDKQDTELDKGSDIDQNG